MLLLVRSSSARCGCCSPLTLVQPFLFLRNYSCKLGALAIQSPSTHLAFKTALNSSIVVLPLFILSFTGSNPPFSRSPPVAPRFLYRFEFAQKELQKLKSARGGPAAGKEAKEAVEAFCERKEGASCAIGTRESCEIGEGG